MSLMAMEGREDTSVYLYPETLALAIWVIIYTFISALCAFFTHILFRLNKQKTAYVSLICIAVFLQQLVTAVQEIVAVARWPEVLKQVWAWDAKMWGRPNASTVFRSNPDIYLRITFQIRVYFFNVESLLFFFWSLLLFTSVWGICWTWIHNPKFITVSRYFSFILPAIVSIVINLPVTQNYATAHLVLMDFIMVITISCGVIFLLLILLKFILVAIEGRRSRKRQRIRIHDDRPVLKTSKEDKWIILRFLVGFLIIGALQTSFLYSQYEYTQHVVALRDPTSPFPSLGWTKEKQLGDWAYYMASSSTGILVILIFGTTPDSRTQSRRLFRRWFRCGGVRRNGKPQVASSSDAEKAAPKPIPPDFTFTTTTTTSSCTRDSNYSNGDDDIYHHSNQDTFEHTRSSIIPMLQAPASVATTPTLHPHQSQNSRLSRPPTDTRFPEVVPTDYINPSMTYRSAGTSYEDEYYYHRDSRVSFDGMHTTRGSIQQGRDRDVVISQYDYRKDGLGRNGTLLRHCVSPLTPEIHTFERFRIQQDPALPAAVGVADQAPNNSSYSSSSSSSAGAGRYT